MTWLRDTLQESIEHLMEGVQIIGFDWTYLYLNPTAAEHGRRTVQDLLGRTMESVYPGIGATPVFATLQEVMRTRRAARVVNEFTYPDGTSRWFDLRIEPVPDGICVLSLDVTEQRALARELEHSQKMDAIGRLVGGVAHDFNNLLTAILGYSDFALDAADEPQLKADLREIQSAGERAARLTRRLLTFSRKHVSVPEVVDLAKVVDELQPILRRLMPDVAVRVAPGPVSHVRADPGQLEQVVLNLAVNARDAMPEGGTLDLGVDRVEIDAAASDEHGVPAGEYVVLTIRDTGMGMPPDVLAHAFEPFFTTKGPDEGTGLGLATVQAAVRQNRGFVDVESRVGAGTTVKVYLPHAGTVAPAARPSAGPASARAGAETILLVEPDQPVHELMRKVLTGCGYTVLHASGAAGALAAAGGTDMPIHLIITDIKMPDMQGSHLAQQLIAHHPEARVLYVTGYPDTRALESGEMSARVALLPKPFTPAALIERVRRTLDV